MSRCTPPLQGVHQTGPASSRQKQCAIAALALSLSLFAVGLELIEFNRGTPLAMGGLVMMLVALPPYLWGCAELARAKGYSTAIVLTFILGGLFPLVVLLALPDKNRHRHWLGNPRQHVLKDRTIKCGKGQVSLNE